MNSYIAPLSAESTLASTSYEREPLCSIVADNPEFLDDLAGIGTGAYLDMRQADTPDYEEWHDANFFAESPGNYLSEEGQSYTEEQLERIYEVLLQEPGNPLVMRLFDGRGDQAGSW